MESDSVGGESGLLELETRSVAVENELMESDPVAVEMGPLELEGCASARVVQLEARSLAIETEVLEIEAGSVALKLASRSPTGETSWLKTEACSGDVLKLEVRCAGETAPLPDPSPAEPCGG